MNLPATVMVGRYRLDLERMTDDSDPARGAWVECWVTSPGGGHTNSLGLLDDLGAFDDGPKVSAADLERIRKAAAAHGYEV